MIDSRFEVVELSAGTVILIKTSFQIKLNLNLDPYCSHYNANSCHIRLTVIFDEFCGFLLYRIQYNKSNVYKYMCRRAR